MAGVISGPAADWLASRRGDLNRRFERLHRRFPTLEPEPTLAVLSEVLPPLAGPEPGADELLSAVYDLVLLEAGRGALATRPGLGRLIGEVFPAVRHLLLERPGVLPGALANAVEKMGERGHEFAGELRRLAPPLKESRQLLDLGAVLAWRLGEARLRRDALEAAGRLPAGTALAALGADGWPETAAPLAIEALRADAWRSLSAVFSDRTLRELRDAPPERVAALSIEVSRPAAAPLASWRVTARVGDFAGFGGQFDAPPLVLQGGTRHRFFARCCGGDFRVDADVFGWVCRPHPQLELGVRPAAGKAAVSRAAGQKIVSSRDTKLAPDGKLRAFGERARFPEFVGAVSLLVLPGMVAVTLADSHRIRIAVPSGEPL